MTKPAKTGPHKVDPENVQPITKDHLKDLEKAELEAHMKHYEELCLASYGQTKSGVFKKNSLPTPKQVTFSVDPEGLQDMMTKSMHQTMIDQSKVFANTIQNAIIDALKQGAEGGYLGPAYFQPKQTPLVFQQNQSANPSIDDPTSKATPSPQAATISSSDIQPIQNKSGDGKAKDHAVTSPVQSNVQDQVLPVQNQQKYPAMRDQYGKLAGWDLPRDHLKTNISNFFESVPEEVPEVKYPQFYEATFGGTPGTMHMNGEGVVFVNFNHGNKAFETIKISPTHAHMVIPTEKRAPIPPQRPNPVPPTSRDVVINDVTLTSLKMREWSQLVFCDDFVTILFWSLWRRHNCSSVTKLVFSS
jgi:hypothetical protein